MNLVRLIVGILFMFFLCSCVSIKHSGSHDVKYCFGAPQIESEENENIKFVDFTHYGFGITDQTISLGYFRRTDIFVKEMNECSAIIYINDYKEFKKVKDYLSVAGKDLNNLCVINGD